MQNKCASPVIINAGTQKKHQGASIKINPIIQKDFARIATLKIIIKNESKSQRAKIRSYLRWTRTIHHDEFLSELIKRWTN